MPSVNMMFTGSHAAKKRSSSSTGHNKQQPRQFASVQERQLLLLSQQQQGSPSSYAAAAAAGVTSSSSASSSPITGVERTRLSCQEVQIPLSLSEINSIQARINDNAEKEGRKEDEMQSDFPVPFSSPHLSFFFFMLNWFFFWSRRRRCPSCHSVATATFSSSSSSSSSSCIKDAFTPSFIHSIPWDMHDDDDDDGLTYCAQPCALPF